MAFAEFKRNVVTENPLLVLGLGLCPAAAMSATLADGLALSCATTFVLVASNVVCSILRNALIGRGQLIGSVLITASFATLAQIGLSEWVPGLSPKIELYIAIVSVNCIVLSRIKVIATRSGIRRSLGDGLLVGLGFSLALCLLCCVREIVGSNTILGIAAIPGYQPMAALKLAPGGFFVLAAGLGWANHLRLRKGRKSS